jgi:hypothetical protein
MGWLVYGGLIAIYLVLLFTVCSMTFRKGYTALGILGIFFPILWLIGAVMSPKPGSTYELQQRARLSA